MQNINSSDVVVTLSQILSNFKPNPILPIKHHFFNHQISLHCRCPMADTNSTGYCGDNEGNEMVDTSMTSQSRNDESFNEGSSRRSNNMDNFLPIFLLDKKGILTISSAPS
jgi:hypothetical protein